MTFPSYWECHHPNWRTPSFFRGVGSTTNQEIIGPAISSNWYLAILLYYLLLMSEMLTGVPNQFLLGYGSSGYSKDTEEILHQLVDAWSPYNPIICNDPVFLPSYSTLPGAGFRNTGSINPQSHGIAFFSVESDPIFGQASQFWSIFANQKVRSNRKLGSIQFWLLKRSQISHLFKRITGSSDFGLRFAGRSCLRSHEGGTRSLGTLLMVGGCNSIGKTLGFRGYHNCQKHSYSGINVHLYDNFIVLVSINWPLAMENGRFV